MFGSRILWLCPRFWVQMFLIVAMCPHVALIAEGVRSFVIANEFSGGGGHTSFVNEEAGAMVFYQNNFFGQNTIIGNVEAGHIWGGHEVFDRAGLDDPNHPVAPSRLVHANLDPSVAPQLGELDRHATAVGHVLAGTGLNEEGNLTFLGAGMAPLAGLWSGAIATEFGPDGSFSISSESMLHPYGDFFLGTEAGRPDVINSSWGGSSPLTDSLTLAIDAMASENPTVAMVASAGNTPGESTVREPASGFNVISVGALEAASFDGENTDPAWFSSAGPVDFYNPETDTVVQNVRVGVHLAAPGENMALAAYLGNTGGGTGSPDAQEDPEDDLYFNFNQSGTSFSAPVVSGGVALLKDVGKELLDDQGDIAMDTRVIRSVLMAGARATPGWDNQQQVVGGEIVTNQVLDPITGAGAIDLFRSVEIYALNTSNLSGSSGGTVSPAGWDFSSLDEDTHNDYTFQNPLEPWSELTLSLNWFAHSAFDEPTATVDDSTARFANLDLEVWRLEEGEFTERYARSDSLYNNTEFLRLLMPEGGEFGFRVLFDGYIYNLSEGINSEDYAVAWSLIVIPEPASLVLALILITVAFGGRLFRRKRSRTA